MQGKPTHGSPLSVLRTSLNMEQRLMKKQKIQSMNKSTGPRGEHLSCLQNTGPETVGAELRWSLLQLPEKLLKLFHDQSDVHGDSTVPG